MKVLLLDTITTKIVSMVYSQTQILEKGVYLVEQLQKKHEVMNHLKAIIFVQPTEVNINYILNELKEPKFKEYHIFFSNILSSELLSKLGRADENELILQIHEYYGDYMAINEDFFHLGIENNNLILSSPYSNTPEANVVYDRNISGLISFLLSIKKRPSVVRYQGSSELARRFANDIINIIDVKEEVLFDFNRQVGPLLLILDRRDDPITPLLTQWTYQAMVHELLGLNNNRVILRNCPGISKDLEEVVLSSTQDDFFAKHRYSNFGDLGTAIKKLLDDYQKISKKNENISSIEDMQSFMERYPEFRSKSINVSKHVAVVGELSRLSDVCQLLEISELEQEIVCATDHSLHKQELIIKIKNPKVKIADKLRLAIIFLLRYESFNEINEIKSLLQEKGVSSAQLPLLNLMLTYAGDARRTPGLFSAGNNSLISKIGKSFSSVGGAQNVYTQHQPLLFHTIDAIVKGKIKDSAYPPCYPLGSQSAASNSATATKPSEIVVFIIGGATYEEAMKVSEFNTLNQSMKVVLGGSCVQNSNSFLHEINAAFLR